VPKKILVPISHVLAIYARENGQGMSFPFDPNQAKPQNIPSEREGGEEPPKPNRPPLKIVK